MLLNSVFSTLAILGATATAFAQNPASPQPDPAPAGSWKLVMESTEKVYTPQTFSDLQARHGDVLGNIDPQAVTWAQLDLKRYGWLGETTCAADDPRLVITGKGFSYCLDRGANGVTACSAASATPAMIQRDPCAR